MFLTNIQTHLVTNAKNHTKQQPAQQTQYNKQHWKKNLSWWKKKSQKSCQYFYRVKKTDILKNANEQVCAFMAELEKVNFHIESLVLGEENIHSTLTIVNDLLRVLSNMRVRAVIGDLPLSELLASFERLQSFPHIQTFFLPSTKMAGTSYFLSPLLCLWVAHLFVSSPTFFSHLSPPLLSALSALFSPLSPLSSPLSPLLLTEINGSGTLTIIDTPGMDEVKLSGTLARVQSATLEQSAAVSLSFVFRFNFVLS